uniref:J domain-containing protein n=1 Tax=Opuntia streptacantha TaxID=393608 RepID=A0A7C8Z7K9_OPUST
MYGAGGCLWRRCSLFLRRELRWLPFLSPHLHSQSHFLSSLYSSFLPRDCARPWFPRNVSDELGKKLSETFCTNSGGGRCWNCNSSPSSEPFLVCESCRCIQPLDPSIDYFQIFGLERKYDIEESSLEGKYKDWQKKLHPDLVHSKSEREREYAAEQSARVIDAYRTLSNRLARAIYLMKLQGVHVDEEQTVSDPDLLAEVMEIRESVEEATNSQALKLIQVQVLGKMKEWSESFARAFKSQETEEALNAIRRMTYYKRANEEIVKRL